MSRSTPLTIADAYLQKWMIPGHSKFDVWLQFVNETNDLFAQRFQVLKGLSEDHDNQPCNTSDLSGMDLYQEDIEDNQRVFNKIIPLSFIGAFNDFEKYFKIICLDLKTDYPTLPDFPGNYYYVRHCVKYLKDNNIVHLDAPLQCLYDRIVACNELRNVIAHNDYNDPDDARMQKLESIGVVISDGVIEELTNLEILQKAINDYDAFLLLLVTRIGEFLEAQ